MRKYLATLHKRPDHHKRRFALVTSGVITLFIFSIWTFVNFGTGGGEVVATADQEASPFESLGASLHAGFESIRESFGQLKSGIKSPKLEEGYEELKTGAINTYGGD